MVLPRLDYGLPNQISELNRTESLIKSSKTKTDENIPVGVTSPIYLETGMIGNTNTQHFYLCFSKTRFRTTKSNK